MRLLKLLFISALLVLALPNLCAGAHSHDSCVLAEPEETTVEVSVLEDALKEMDQNGIVHLNILLQHGTIALTKEALSAVLDEAGEKVSFSIREVDSSALSSAQSSAAGGRPVYEIRITGDSSINSLDAAANISVPYQLSESEDPSKLCIWHINSDGSREILPASYKNGFLSFETNSFSYFAAGYETPDPPDKTLHYLLLASLVVLASAILAVFLLHKKQAY